MTSQNSSFTTFGSEVIRNINQYSGTTSTQTIRRADKTVSLNKQGLNLSGGESLADNPPPIHSFTYDKVDVLNPRGVKEFRNYSGLNRSSELHTGIFDPNDYSVVTHRTVPGFDKVKFDGTLRNDVRNQLKDSSINTAVAVAELDQTAKLVATTAIRLGKAISHLRKGNFGAAAEAVGIKASNVSRRARKRFNRGFAQDQSKAFASGWLELQYGWKPLLSDVYGAAEQLAKVNRPLWSRTSRSKTYTSTVNSSDWNSLTYGTKVYRSTIQRYTVKYVLYYTVANPLLVAGKVLGLTNPALVVWEKVPFSFVVDWFLPIGNFLSSLDATVGLSFHSGCKTEYERLATNHNIQGGYTGAASSYREDVSMYRINTTVVRTRLSEFPTAAWPSFKNPASLLHAANAVALLSTLKK